MEKSIIKNEIKELIKDKPVRMHMPGHKGRKRGYRLDITEIPGADNLHNPKGILKRVQEKISSIYGSKNCYLLVNGSTAGIQASLLSSVNEGDKILIPVNAHRSVYPALSFTRAHPVYYKPIEKKYGMYVTKEQVEELLQENPDVKALLVVSPDYYGNLSELEEISKLVKEKEIVLIVDEAHGGHLSFLSDNKDAVSSGADFVIQSTHKTLGAPTQGALLHISDKVDQRKVQRILALIETSSPSYFLMNGIEEAVDQALNKANSVFKRIYHAHDAMEKNQETDDLFRLVSPDGNVDKSKFLFSFPKEYPLEEKLINQFHIIPEFISGNLCLFMTGIGTNQRDLNKLFTTVNLINKELKDGDYSLDYNPQTVESYIQPYKTEKELYEVIGRDSCLVFLEEAEDEILNDFIVPYPPGVPYLIPGSKISKENINIIKKLVDKNININGIDIDNENKILIEVLKETKEN